MWLIAIAALGGVLFSALGIAMVVDLAPYPITHQWTVAGYVYLVAFFVSLSILVGAVITLTRRRVRGHSNDASAAV